MIWTLAFWKGAGERAFHAFWQTFVAILTLNIGGELIPAVGVEAISWPTILSGSAMAAILSLAKSFATPDFTAGTPVAVVELDAAPIVEAVRARTVDLTPPVEDWRVEDDQRPN